MEYEEHSSLARTAEQTTTGPTKVPPPTGERSTGSSGVFLSNDKRYGTYLDAMMVGKARARLTVEQLRSQSRENRAR